MGAKIKSTELQDKGIFIIEPKGSFIGGDETDDLKFAIREIADNGNIKLVIDLGDVLYLNSTALGVLISAHANYKKRDGEIKLTRLNKNLENLFVITKLSLIFDCFNSQQEAIESFNK
jgi:anti-sigma B factor antagonist